jgi:hypothetical protein
MRKSNWLFIFSVLFFCFSIYGQKGETTPDKFYSVLNEAQRKQFGFNRRVITKTETFSNGKIEKNETVIYEIILPDKTRYKSTKTVGETLTEFEVIKIGFDEYTRRSGGEWKYRDLRGAGMGIGVGNGFSFIGEPIFKYTVFADTLNNQPTQIYEEYIEVEDSIGLRFNQKRIWINQEGLILKQETKFGYLNPENIVSQSVITYEYNPKDIKIEAPKIVSEKP